MGKLNLNQIVMKKNTFQNRVPVAFVMTLFLLPVSLAQKLDTEKLNEIKARSIGPAGMSGRVTSVEAVTSNPQIIYIGTASGGVWKSTNGGTSWEAIFDDQKIINIGAIAITQSNPDIVWAGTGEGNPRNSMNLGAGIFKTMDGGLNWEFMGLEKTKNIHRIIIDPRDENVIYVGAHGNPWGEHPERGVYKTTDGGKTWDKILFVDNKTGVGDLVMDPENPNKLICAMWEHRRWPWYFKSGGPGSGMYVTIDGGKTWTERTSEDGLPKGDLGRMGLAIAPSNTNIVYAIVEAEKNAMYRSGDGGKKWIKISDKPDIGNRPFYYFDIYVDPDNENRIYTLYSVIGVSEDGGKSFRTIANNIHSDHHAWWIHPNDPNYIIEGNDGGMAISRDRGETWHFMENLPLGQWYHIRVDNDLPYNVYGGLQDNGSWRGPGYVWRSGGIRNEYWQEVMFGDGFDVLPDPDNSRYGYAMSQGGNVGRYDYLTGISYSIKPSHPDPNMKLRFNWNAGMEQDPFDNSTIYFGSQFLHKSADKGLTWNVISPDLTSNDPDKQTFRQSGGLTLDVTGAENHTTITEIAVSPIEKGLIWVGTDDGNIQLTRDGGANWTNLSSKLPGLPVNSWINQIQASSYSAGEAWVVANNYRLGDFAPYVYRTRNYGAKWERIVNEVDVNGYALCLVQDAVEPNLVFLGTENGLWVSIDNAGTWSQWKHGYPSVSTMDMVIQEKEADLVIGTFGRSIYILDDIRPLREIARSKGKVFEQKFKLFDPPEAIILKAYQQPIGTHFPGDATFEGDNKPIGGILTYYFREDEKDEDETEKYDSIKIEIFDEDELIRTLKYKARPGVRRVTWRLRKKGVMYPTASRGRGGAGVSQREPAGFTVTPGIYKIVMTCGDQRDSTMMTVKWDPRLDIDMAGLAACEKMYNEVSKSAEALFKATTRLNESREVLSKISQQVSESKEEELMELSKQTKAVEDSLNLVWTYIMGKEETKQGISDRNVKTVVRQLSSVSQGIQSRPSGPTATEYKSMEVLDGMIDKALHMTNSFFSDIWPEYRILVEDTDFKWFRDYDPIKVE
jgi:photosystem II stability/assembly factor-like uncharacterized protein